jgi:hypothetical protein
MFAHSTEFPLIEEDEDYDFEFERLRLRQKTLSKYVEVVPVKAPRDIDKDGSRREVAHLLAPDELTEFSVSIDSEKQKRDTEELLNYEEINRQMLSSQTRNKKQPANAPVVPKKPSKNLPHESVITKKDAFHAGAKNGTGAHMFYRVPDYIKALLKKRPWPRGGKVAHMVDLVRNETRVLYQNIEKLRSKLNILQKECKHDFAHRRTKALLFIFLLEDNCYKLKTSIENLKLYNGLLKGNATIGFLNTIVKGKETLGEPDPFFIERDAFYAKETELFEKLAKDTNIITDAKAHLDYYELSIQNYEQWREDNWRTIRKQFNRYKGAGCITGQAIQGMVTVLINTGIAVGVHSPVAAAAAGLYALSTTARIFQTVVRTTLENNLIEHTENRRVDSTILKANANAKIIKSHQQYHTLKKVEEVVNQVEGLLNSAINSAGTLTGLACASAKPATITPPLANISAPIMDHTRPFFDVDEAAKTGIPLGMHRRRMRF